MFFLIKQIHESGQPKLKIPKKPNKNHQINRIYHDKQKKI